jgi:hypothetical protein
MRPLLFKAHASESAAASRVDVRAPPRKREHHDNGVRNATLSLGARLVDVGAARAGRREHQVRQVRRQRGVREGQLQVPARAQGDSVGVELLTVAARAGLGLRWRHAIARVGLGVDFVRVSPERATQDASAMLTSDRWSQSLVVSGAAGAAFGLGKRVDLELRLLADVLPTAVHYDLETGAGAVPVFSPRRFRPGLSLACLLR